MRTRLPNAAATLCSTSSRGATFHRWTVNPRLSASKRSGGNSRNRSYQPRLNDLDSAALFEEMERGVSTPRTNAPYVRTADAGKLER